MTAAESASLSSIALGRERFLELVAEIRPELHRYCARMTGTVFDGEDVVQETLAKAHYALGEMEDVPPLRPWLFRIAHNTAMDFLRRYEKKHVDVVAEVPEAPAADDPGPDAALVEAALEVFIALPPLQRSAIALKDVLGHSLEETAATMGTTVGAVKSALVRARAAVAARREPERRSAMSEEDRRALERYAGLFNARDWDGLRALLVEESRLDLVSRSQRRGAGVAHYYGRYDAVADDEGLRAVPGIADGAPVLAVFASSSDRPRYFIRLEWHGDRVALIRDFRYVPYIVASARFTLAQ